MARWSCWCLGKQGQRFSNLHFTTRVLVEAQVKAQALFETGGDVIESPNLLTIKITRALALGQPWCSYATATVKLKLPLCN